MPGTSVSVVICAYTEARWNDLVTAVESVTKQTRPPIQIVVVIDHNPSMLERARQDLPGAFVLPNSEQKGLSGARNTGIWASTGDIVAFLDDDAIAAPDWIERLIAAYEGPQVAGVGGAIDPLWETGRPAWFPREFDWVVGCTYEGMPKTRAPQRNLIGANMSLRRSVFEAVGGFESGMGRVGTIPLGCEETELCIRAGQRLGSVMIYEPAARVRHRVPASRSTWGYFKSRCFSEGLSKAQVSRMVGATSGLESERRYTTRVLPRGVWRGLRDAVLGSDPGGLGRSAAIVAGLALTGFGYVIGSLRARPAGGVRSRAIASSIRGAGSSEA